jgi:formylglycine-generating enzyme required for sulfatase activity
VGTCTPTTQAGCTSPGTWSGAGTNCLPNRCFLPNFVLVLAGTFLMGSPVGEPGRVSDETQHTVVLTDSLYVCKHEVTQSEWRSVMGWNESAYPGDNRPVEEVTWFDAVTYCNDLSSRDGYDAVYAITGVTSSGNHITAATVTLIPNANGYRLLTEAEWEYTCRATSISAFCNGGVTNVGLNCSPLDPNLDAVGWYCGNSSNTTHDVEGKSANLWGLKDMHCNVQEWCWDWYAAAYPSGPVSDPVGPASGSYRVLRGGSLLSYARNSRSAVRIGNVPSRRYYNIGLRVAKAAP